MIGILAKLAKAAKMAQTAEAAIDLASNKLAPGEEPPAEEKPEPLGAEKLVEVPGDFRGMLKSGVPDPRKLLSSDEVEQIVRKRIRSASLAATGDCLVCDYHCKDRAGTVLGVHISTTMPWEGFDTEIEKKELFDDLGDAAFRSGRQIYVKAGDTVFWIHTAGEVMVDMAVKAARVVLSRL